MKYQVLYLTGAPATGKSTLAQELARHNGLAVWDYGQELLNRVAERANTSYEELRGNSAGLITSADVAKTDEDLITWTEERRQQSHVLIDTHAVTRESFGFRITPFSTEQVTRLKPTILIGLYAEPEVVRARLDADAAGRLGVTPFEASFHASVQASVLATYAITCGVPAYILDSSRDSSVLVSLLNRLMGE